MSQTIKLRRSATSGSIPTTAQLNLGELAINTYDGKLFLKKSVGGTETIVEVGATNLADSFKLYEYSVTSSTSVFSGSDDNSNTLSYNTGSPPYVSVFLNGLLLDWGTDYNATNGTSISLTTAAASGDLIQIEAYKSTVVTDTNLQFDDDVKALFGNDGDLEIFHNGTRSIINDAGTGNLQFQIGGSAIYDVTTDGIVLNNGLDVEANEFIGDLRGAVLFKAQAGEALAKGDVVYISGISGNTTIVSKADADDANKMPAFGVAATAITSGTTGDIYTFGTLSGLDTSGFTLGDELYVSTTAGALTNSAPTGSSAQIQKIAKVTRSDNSAGSIKIMGAGRSNATPNLDEGKIFVGNSSNQSVQVDDTIHVDMANSRVGINTTSPDATLHVKGSSFPQLRIADDDDNMGIGFAGNTFYIKRSDNNGEIVFRRTDNSDPFKFDMSSASMTITSTDDGSSAGPDLILYRNSASPADADYIGQIQFKGRQDGPGDEIYAKVTGKITDASNGTEDGLIETAIKGNGSFTIVSRQKSDELQLLNGVSLSVDGNLMVGNTSAGAKLDVRQDSGYAIRAENGSGHYFRVAAGGAIEVGGSAFVDASRNITAGTISSGNITTTGYLRGPSSFTIDPAAHGDDTGTVVIAGNLQVDGTTTTINSTTVTVDDKNIELANGAANAAAADGAGITVAGASATLTYAATGDKWSFNKDIDVTGTVTADKLEVSDNTPSYGLYEADTTDLNTITKNAGGIFKIQTINDAKSSTKNRLQIDHATGDLSLFEDTGTTAKFYWDASAERLGIGTTSPGGKLDIRDSTTGGLLSRVWNTNTSGSGSAIIRIANNGNNGQGARLEFSDSGYYTGTIASDRSNGIEFYTGQMANSLATKKMTLNSSGLHVVDNISHTGLTMTSGTDIDQLYTATVSLQLSTSWQDTGINGTDLSAGTYIIQLYADDYNVSGGHYREFYSGIMSWASEQTNSTETDEILLHRAGHAPNNGVIYLRTERVVTADTNRLMLQIRGDLNTTGSDNYVFKFRRMI